jgi:hypothetical protein
MRADNWIRPFERKGKPVERRGRKATGPTLAQRGQPGCRLDEKASDSPVGSQESSVCLMPFWYAVSRIEQTDPEHAKLWEGVER